MTNPPADSGGYLVLARKYRPENFSQLIGQAPMVQTLRNAFTANRLAQVFMLTGVRGVGKTSTARLLARAVNFERKDQASGETFDLAEYGLHCKAILEGHHIDVIEMDAASHTSIEDIREIISGVGYKPIAARYKVYIIDEVHMLSSKAFNGLLKTLEEPPPHTKFILATTELRKIPVTILSRCQRFELRRITIDDLVKHLRHVVDREAVEAEQQALVTIARAGEGSVRDALSLLDQAIAYGDNRVTDKAVRMMLGLVGSDRKIELFTKLMAGDLSAALSIFRSIYQDGGDPFLVIADLADFTHYVTRIVHLGEDIEAGVYPEAERLVAIKLANKLEIAVLIKTWQLLLKGLDEIRGAHMPLLAAEMVLVRIGYVSRLPPLDELIGGKQEAKQPAGKACHLPNPDASLKGDSAGCIAQNGDSAGCITQNGDSAGCIAQNGDSAGCIAQNGDSAGCIAQNGDSKRGSLGGAPIKVNQDAASLKLPEQDQRLEHVQAPTIREFEDLINLAGDKRSLRLKIALETYVRPLRIEHGKLEIAIDDGAPEWLVSKLTHELSDWTGRSWDIQVVKSKAVKTLHETKRQQKNSQLRELRKKPLVASVLNQFPGAKITGIKKRGDQQPKNGK